MIVLSAQDTIVLERLLIALKVDGQITPVLYDTSNKKDYDDIGVFLPLVIPADEEVVFMMSWPNTKSERFVLFDEHGKYRIDLPKGW
jgi:hypothetical protein